MFQCILEMRGWRGITHTSVHARDLKIYVEASCFSREHGGEVSG